MVYLVYRVCLVDSEPGKLNGSERPDRPNMIRIVHVISDLDVGGAEVMLAKLVVGMDKRGFANTVVSLTDGGQLGEAITAAGIPVHSLGMKRSKPDLSGLSRLIRLLKATKPNLVQSWLYHADFLSLLAAPFAGSPPLLWNVRCSDMDFRHYPSLTRWTVRALALGSRRPVAVVSNSVAGQRLHQRLGYRPRRWEVIPNGIDLSRFQPDASARGRFCAELGLAAETAVVGLVARVDPMKDHAMFLDAARRVADVRSGVHFVLIGKGTEMLTPMVAAHKLAGQVHLLGFRNDVEHLLPALDVACLSSAFGEGFPTVLAESMACGIPCVTTDVGDARSIVADTGLVVPVRDPASLAHAIIDLIDRGPAAREQLGRAARVRIETEYSLSRIVDQYTALYSDLSFNDSSAR